MSDPLADERAAALAQIEALTREFDGVVAASRASNADDEHDPEGATIAFERQQVAALIAQAQQRLADVDAALADVPDGAPRVVLTHNPSIFPELPPDSAPLTLAGHTHCGQIAIPGLPGWSYLELTEQEEVVTDGWAPEDHGAEGNRLFVTCGIGFSVVPARINAPPQVAFFELQPGA